MHPSQIAFWVILAIASISLVVAYYVWLPWAATGSAWPGESNPDAYRLVFETRNVQDVRKNFVLENPLGDGEDPTDGWVDYAWAMPRDKNGAVLPNVNGDRFWSEIPASGRIDELLKNEKNGGWIHKNTDYLITRGLFPSIFGPTCMATNYVGSARLMTRKLFLGGLFIMDCEHIPMSTLSWPAVWLYNFIGMKDFYHAEEGTPLFSEGMRKLYDATQNKRCPNVDKSLDPYQSLDTFMSRYSGTEFYTAQWPRGGEFDIIEQVNFSERNLVSIHGGSNCEVIPTNLNESKDNIDFAYPFLSDFHRENNLRSTCGLTTDRNPPNRDNRNLGYESCKTQDNAIGTTNDDRSCPIGSATNSGNSQVLMPVGSFGAPFNNTGGGVFVCQWIPKKLVGFWFFPRKLFSDGELKRANGPLSSNPDPTTWEPVQKEYQVLAVSYALDGPNAITSGCDFNYGALIINNTLGGGWGSAPPFVPESSRSGVTCACDKVGSKPTAPSKARTLGTQTLDGETQTGGGTVADSCSGFSTAQPICGDYALKDQSAFLNACYTAKPGDANASGVAQGCYDGAWRSKEEGGRGVDAPPVFQSENYFKFRDIRVFQNPRTDDNIW